MKEQKTSEDHRAGNHGAGRTAFPGLTRSCLGQTYPGSACPRGAGTIRKRCNSLQAAARGYNRGYNHAAAQSPPAPTATAPPALPALIKPFQHHCFVSTISHVQRFLQPQRPITNESTSCTIAAHGSGQIFATQTPSSSAFLLPPPKRTYFVTETFILGKYFNIVNKSIYLPHILNKFMLIVKQNCFYFNNGLQPLNSYCSQLIL